MSIQNNVRGLGRRLKDPELEQKTIDFVLGYLSSEGKFRKLTEGKMPARRKIRNYARTEYDNFKLFKASKGWCDKFMKRNLATFVSFCENNNLLFS